jgi:hypothetical protein
MELRTQCFVSCLHKFCWGFVSSYRIIYFEISTAISNSEVLGSGTNGSAVCISVRLKLSTPCTLNIWEKNFSTYSKYCGNLLATTLLIFYQVISRFVTFLTLIYAPLRVFNVLVFTSCLKLSNFVFQIFSPPVPEMFTTFTSSAYIFKTTSIYISQIL